MSDDALWMPCRLCRCGYKVQREHWLGFASAEELARHLEEFLSIAQKENGVKESALQEWSFQQRFKTLKAEACYDPMRSVNEMFERQLGKRR